VLGEEYFANEEDAENEAREDGYASMAEAYKSNPDCYYWTQWDDPSDDQFVELPNGEIVDIDDDPSYQNSVRVTALELDLPSMGEYVTIETPDFASAYLVKLLEAGFCFSIARNVPKDEIHVTVDGFGEGLVTAAKFKELELLHNHLLDQFYSDPQAIDAPMPGC
jgi:hypothetical protein